MKIFDMTGPEFLKFYLALAGAALVAGIFLRRTLSGGLRDAEPDPNDLDSFDVAYLSGKKAGLCNALVASLIQRRIASFTADRLLKISGGFEGELQPAEKNLLAAVTPRDRYKFRALRKLVDDEPIRRKLEERELLNTPGQESAATFVPFLLMLAVTAIGAIRLFNGMSRHKPVGFLVLLLILTIVAMIAFCRPAFRTLRGTRTLKFLRDENAALLANAKAKTDALAAPDVALALALWGPVVLSGALFDDFRKTLIVQGGSGGDGGGCGGGGCGGGCGGCGG